MLSTYVVNTFVDQIDPPGSNTISLRDAIARAAAHPGADTIDIPAGRYKLTHGELLIDDATGLMTLNGMGGIAVINAQRKSRVLEIASAGVVSGSGLEITDGTLQFQFADAILNHGNLVLSDSTISGNLNCGIANYGTAVLSNDVISGNMNGGVSNSGVMTMTDDTVSGNRTVYRFGAGVTNSKTLTISDSTISGNSAIRRRGYHRRLPSNSHKRHYRRQHRALRNLQQ